MATGLTGSGWWQGYFTLRRFHLAIYAVVIAVVFLVTAAFVPAVRPSVLIQLGIIEASIGVIALLLRSGMARAAAGMAIASAWVIATGAALATGGMSGVNYATFASILVLAGVLLGTWGAVAVAALTLLLGLLAPAGGGAVPGLIHPVATAAPPLLRIATAYVFIIIFLAVAQREMRDVLRSNSKALSLLRATLESTADGILVVDTKGRVQGHNQKFLDLWGIPPDLAEARDDQRLIAHVRDQLRDPEGFSARIQQLYDTNDSAGFDVLEFRDGRLYERYSQPQKQEGRTVGRVWSFRDVTERRRAESTRRRLEEELFQAQKMEALGRLAGGIAHDFNNILTAIISYSEIARLDSADRPAVLESLDEVLRAGQRARDLVSQILIFSRTRAHERVPVRLRAIVVEALQTLNSSLPKAVDVSFEEPGEDFVVLAEPTQIHQVVMNLGINAGQAIGDAGGRVLVRLEPVTLVRDGVPPAPGLAPGRYMVLTVSDTGPGMDPTTLARIYEPFFSTKAPGKGTGLGLAMVHSIVRNHQGGIAAESIPGKGTSFRVYFPLHVSPEELPAGRGTDRAGSIRGQRVLLVDDEPAIADAARVLLQRVGYRVETATDGAAALARFAADPGGFDALVTDLHMPGMGGVELLERVQALRPGLPIVIATGSPATLPGSLPPGSAVSAIIEKPYTIARLAGALEQALRRGTA